MRPCDKTWAACSSSDGELRQQLQDRRGSVVEGSVGALVEVVAATVLSPFCGLEMEVVEAFYAKHSSLVSMLLKKLQFCYHVGASNARKQEQRKDDIKGHTHG